MNLHELISKTLAIEDEDYLGNKRMIDDGIYDVSNVEFVHWPCSMFGSNRAISEEKFAEVKAFVEKHRETFVIGTAYETYNAFLLATKPPKANLKEYGGGFEGHGTSALLDMTANPITKLLILGEND